MYYDLELYEIENAMKTGQPKDLWFNLLEVGDTVFTGYGNEIIRKKYDSAMIGFDANGADNLSKDGYRVIAVSALTPPVSKWKLFVVKTLRKLKLYEIWRKYLRKIQNEFKDLYVHLAYYE